MAKEEQLSLGKIIEEEEAITIFMLNALILQVLYNGN